MDYSQAFFVYIALLKIVDALTVIGVWHLCWYLRFDSTWIPVTKGIPDASHYSAVTIPLAIVYTAMFHIVGAYRRDRIHLGFRSLKKLVQGSVLGLLVFIATVYFQAEVYYSRIYLASFLTLVIPALIIERTLLQIGWWFFETRGVKKIRMLLVGSGELLELYVRKVIERKPYPIEWVGRLGSKGGSGALELVPYLGEESRLHALLQKMPVDQIVISFPTSENNRYGEILEPISNELFNIKVLPDFGRYSTFSYAAEHECGIPLLNFNKTPVGATDRVLKRTIDIIGSLGFIVVASPLYLAIALAIRLTSKGPIVYKQERIGADGSTFTIYKFRSMRVDAERETGAVWAKPDDKRTTELGKWLRRTSLDEIPQFFNVLRGDMSLVGPRPERPVFVTQFRREIPKYMLRHKMKSGITGWAQVNGWRGNTSLDERIKHDLYYIGNWSLFLDIKIMCLTVFKGFVNRHAY